MQKIKYIAGIDLLKTKYSIMILLTFVVVLYFLVSVFNFAFFLYFILLFIILPVFGLFINTKNKRSDVTRSIGCGLLYAVLLSFFYAVISLATTQI